MSVSLNIEANSAKIFRLFRVSSTSFASILIDTSVNCNTEVSSTEFFRSFYVSDSSSDDNVNLFCNVDSNLIFNDEIFS